MVSTWHTAGRQHIWLILLYSGPSFVPDRHKFMKVTLLTTSRQQTETQLCLTPKLRHASSWAWNKSNDQTVLPRLIVSLLVPRWPPGIRGKRSFPLLNTKCRGVEEKNHQACTSWYTRGQISQLVDNTQRTDWERAEDWQQASRVFLKGGHLGNTDSLCNVYG